MSAAKDPRKVLQGMRSRAQGDQFEGQIAVSCSRHLDNDEADISKTPEPMKPLGRPNAYGQFKACYVKKAEPDFKGVIAGGRAIMFEAKSTATGKMEQSRVLPDQEKKLDAYMALGAHCFVLATFDGLRAYQVPWSVWRRMKEIYGRKYVTEEDVKEYAVRFAPGFTYDLLWRIPSPDHIGPGARLEDLLTAFCGLPWGVGPDAKEWGHAYDRLTNLLYAVGGLTETSVDHIIERLDAIDRRDGEV